MQPYRPRWIVRPKAILTTPKILRDALGARRCVAYPDSRGRKFSFINDFFLIYPPEEELLEYNAWSQTNSTREQLGDYQRLRSFAAGSKPSQRESLGKCGIPIPATASTRTSADALGPGRYVVRPLRHSGGRDYRITEDSQDFVEGKEYISRLFPKRHEYRVIYLKGRKVITLIKKVPEGIDPDGPWNHAAGSRFVTVHDPDNDRLLKRTDAYSRLESCDIIKSAHLVAADILLGKKQDGYVVTELNFCPALTIETNLDLVKQHVSPSTSLQEG